MNSSPRSAARRAAALFLLTCLAYSSVWRADFIWDDDQYVQNNDCLRTPAGLWRIWTDPYATPQYYPLVHTSYWLQYQMWGLHPRGYHVVNILIHAASAGLVWVCLRRLGLRSAWLAAALFAVHPVHVESVAWITEHKNVLSGFCFLAALACLLKFFRLEGEAAEAPADQARRPWRWYVAGTVLFIAALLSKTVACSLPAAMLLILYWRRGRVTGREIWPLAPWFMLGLGLGLLTAWLERARVGATGADFDWNWAERCLIAGRALWMYAGKLLAPFSLSFFYPQWNLEVGRVQNWLWPLAAVAVPVVCWFRRVSWGRGPLVAVLWFGGTLLPALGFFNVYPLRYSFVADHFQYLASLGLIVLAAEGFVRCFGPSLSADSAAVPEINSAGGGLPAPLRAPLQGIVLCVLMALTWQRGWVFENLESLWRDTLAKHPECWIAHNNLGRLLLQRGDTLLAQAEFEETLRIKPNHTEALSNLGVVLDELGQLAKAEQMLRQAVAVEPRNYNAWFNLGETLVHRGRLKEAEQAYLKSDQLLPNRPVTAMKIGNTKYKLGDTAGALLAYRMAIERDPQWGEAYGNVGLVYMELQQPGPALEALNRAVELSPQLTLLWYWRGEALEQLQRFDEAGGSWRRGRNSPSVDPKLAVEFDAALQRLERLKAAPGRTSPPPRTP